MEDIQKSSNFKKCSRPRRLALWVQILFPGGLDQGNWGKPYDRQSPSVWNACFFSLTQIWSTLGFSTLQRVKQMSAVEECMCFWSQWPCNPPNACDGIHSASAHKFPLWSHFGGSQQKIPKYAGRAWKVWGGWVFQANSNCERVVFLEWRGLET